MSNDLINKLFGYDDRPKMSSWAREQMQKEQDSQGYKYSQLIKKNIPTKEECLKKEKTKKRIYTMFIIVLVLLTSLYESMSGNTIEQAMESFNVGTSQTSTIQEP